MDEDHQTCTTKQENLKKITNFDRHAALFNGASMGAIT
jgi:hypothetical protein